MSITLAATDLCLTQSAACRQGAGARAAAGVRLLVRGSGMLRSELRAVAAWIEAEGRQHER
jgi:DNA-binding transcriptional LysR family regulator